jgi:hypothetical protein
MKLPLVPVVFGALTLTLSSAAPILAQTDAGTPQSVAPQTVTASDGAAQDTMPQINAAELDQVLAPIALYPDSLLTQILMASTFPLEIVEADRWLQEPGHAALKSAALAGAIEQLGWDPSVKALAQFPRILRMMDLNLQWTEQLGDAFQSDQAGVMAAVQTLRRKAETAGTFRSNAKQVVSNDGGVISVLPTSPDIVYVPVYDPATVYGGWPNPDYPPDYFPEAFDGLAYDGLDFGGPGLGWFGVAVVEPLWGWGRLDWRDHRIDVNAARWTALNHNRPPRGGEVWQHTAPARLAAVAPPPMLMPHMERSAALPTILGPAGEAGRQRQVLPQQRIQHEGRGEPRAFAERAVGAPVFQPRAAVPRMAGAQIARPPMIRAAPPAMRAAPAVHAAPAMRAAPAVHIAPAGGVHR